MQAYTQAVFADMILVTLFGMGFMLFVGVMLYWIVSIVRFRRQGKRYEQEIKDLWQNLGTLEKQTDRQAETVEGLVHDFYEPFENRQQWAAHNSARGD